MAKRNAKYSRNEQGLRAAGWVAGVVCLVVTSHPATNPGDETLGYILGGIMLVTLWLTRD